MFRVIPNRVFLRAAVLDACHLLLKAGYGMGAPPSRDRCVKQLVDLFQRLAGRFRVGQVNMEDHGEAEGAKDHVCLPLDVGERGGDEEGESQVEANEEQSVRTLDIPQ